MAKLKHGARKHTWCTQAAWAKRKKERKKERLNNGDNNGQAKAWRTQARMAHASRLGQNEDWQSEIVEHCSNFPDNNCLMTSEALQVKCYALIIL